MKPIEAARSIITSQFLNCDVALLGEVLLEERLRKHLTLIL